MAQEEAKKNTEMSRKERGIDEEVDDLTSHSGQAKDGQLEMDDIPAQKEAKYYKPPKGERKKTPTAFKKEKN